MKKVSSIKSMEELVVFFGENPGCRMSLIPPRKETHEDTLVTTSFWKLGLKRPGRIGGFVLMIPEGLSEFRFAAVSKSGLSIKFYKDKAACFVRKIVDFKITLDNYRLVLDGPEGKEVYSLNGPDA